MSKIKSFFGVVAFGIVLISCGVYTTKDVSIPAEIKTVKLNYIENKARYVNPQLSPQLTDRLQQKIVSQTRLQRVTTDDADWVINGTITDYSISTSGISSQQVSTNRLTVSASINLKDNVNQKTQDYTASRSFEFPANQTIQQAEATLGDEIIRGLSEEIFNRLFSNW